MLEKRLLKPRMAVSAKRSSRSNGGGGVSVDPPVITSSATFNAAENQTAVGTITATGAAPITYSISGTDSALFAVNSSSGVLTFLLAPDYETPGDAGGDNVYNLTVTATNAGGATNQNVAVTVTDVAEPPIVSPAAWYRYNSGITVTGAGVSQWDDASGNGHHLLQATDAKRPAKQAGGEILFNGTSHSLKTGAWTLAQPVTIYMLLKQVTWTSGDYLYSTADNAYIRDLVATPNIYLTSNNGAGFTSANTNLTLDTYKALAGVHNGASSILHVNGSAATTGSTGTGGINTLVLGSIYVEGAGWSNIQVKEILVYAGAHDATQRQTVFDYLAGL